ncbi:MAG: 16S rRNA (uracil(1498)-N(3))-methyltransferase [Victivallaceae bacterium]|nr:RsmE family RNA methyltransferase [Victivallaceae bacterium]
MRCFYAETIGEPGTELELNRAEASHLFVTLRGRPGERVALLDGNGVSAEAEILAGRRLRVVERELHAPPSLKVHLFCASPRRRELDLILKQAAETGASGVNLIECERSVATPDGGAIDRWRGIVIEGCKQSRNFFAPVLGGPESLSAAVRRVGASGTRMLFGSVAAGGNRPHGLSGEVALFVGPEGGFTPDEEAFMRENGVEGWNFSPNVLRLETAAACGVALLKYLAEERR